MRFCRVLPPRNARGPKPKKFLIQALNGHESHTRLPCASIVVTAFNRPSSTLLDLRRFRIFTSFSPLSRRKLLISESWRPRANETPLLRTTHGPKLPARRQRSSRLQHRKQRKPLMVSERLLFLERLKPLPMLLALPLHKESSWTTSQEYVAGQTENLTFHEHPTFYPS